MQLAALAVEANRSSDLHLVSFASFRFWDTNKLFKKPDYVFKKLYSLSSCDKHNYKLTVSLGSISLHQIQVENALIQSICFLPKLNLYCKSNEETSHEDLLNCDPTTFWCKKTAKQVVKMGYDQNVTQLLEAGIKFRSKCYK